MLEKFVESLDDIILSKEQSAWIKYAYPLDDQIEEANIARSLGDELPLDFNPYRDLNHLWAHNRLSIFGRYKVNVNDDLLRTMDEILKVLRDKFIKIPSKKFVSTTELSEATGRDKEVIKRVLNNGYFHEFWTGDDNAGRVNYDQKLNENVYEFTNINEYQKIRKYLGLKEQIEKQWQRLHRPQEIQEKEIHSQGLVPTKRKNVDETNAIQVGSDTPQTNPENDVFGYSKIARRISEIVQKTSHPQGLVMAIHGSWGSGKTTVLNFVKHNRFLLKRVQITAFNGFIKCSGF